MATPKIWYPHFVDVPAGLASTVEAVPAFNHEHFEDMAASSYAPQFRGVLQASPEIMLRTRNVETILADLDANGLSKDHTAGDVKLYFRAGMNKGIRQPDANDDHSCVIMHNSAFMCWESLTAEQNSPAEISVRYKTVFDSAGAHAAASPWVWLGAANPLPVIDFNASSLFTLGPVIIGVAGAGNDVAIPGVTSLNWENGIVMEEQFSDGETYPSYQGIRTTNPIITVTTNDMASIGLISPDTPAPGSPQGTCYVEYMDFYLREIGSCGGVTPNTTAAHIRLRSNFGFSCTTQIANNPANITFEFRPMIDTTKNPPDAGQELFIISTDATIPAEADT